MSFSTAQARALPEACPQHGTGRYPADGRSLVFQIIRVESIQVAGQDVKSPAATRIVGGWAMQFLLFALSAAATALFYERDHGIFHRILAGPVSRAQILWSKFVFDPDHVCGRRCLDSRGHDARVHPATQQVHLGLLGDGGFPRFCGNATFLELLPTLGMTVGL
jgi:hypothetical protein